MNDVIGISPVAQYNGNIASQSWGTSAAPNTKSFTYVYDRLNRLSSGSATDNNKESGITYDQAGNIGTLNRYQANVLTDKLAYTYTAGANHTNQLQTVANTGASNIDMGLGTTSYLYDGNGNMLSAANTADTIHNKSFTYNLLNLPIVATVPNGTATYTYDANGNKLRTCLKMIQYNYLRQKFVAHGLSQWHIRMQICRCCAIPHMRDNTLQQRAKYLIVSDLSADKILSLTKQCQHFFCFRAIFCVSLMGCVLAEANGNEEYL